MRARWVGPSSRIIRGASGPVAVAVSCLLLVCTGGSAAGQKLGKAADTWLKQYRMLVLPDEVKALRQIKDPADVAEFERIFWARRNPAPPGSENSYKAAIDKARLAADERFSDTGRKGSITGCGQVLMLLGDPDEVQGTEIRTTFEDRPQRRPDTWRPPADRGAGPPESSRNNATRDGARRPETWTYKSNTQRTYLLPRGDLRLQFDSGCEFEEGARVMDELTRVAAQSVRHPEIQYEFGPDGRLRRLAAAAAPPSKPAILLDQLRSDFAADFEMKVQMPGQGGAYTAGILRGAPGALPRTPAGGGQPVPLRAVARATPQAGDAVAFAEREVFALVQPDGSFVTSYGFTLPPGRYSVSIGLLEPTSGRSTVTTGTIETPDYAGKALVVGPLVVLSGAETAATSVADPYAAFVVGGDRLVPRPGNVLSQAESLRLLVLVHNAALDPSNNKASLRAAFSVLQDGKLVAKGKEQYFDTPGAAPEVGPIALTPFAPGRYLARVEITDEVAKTAVVRETPFEVRPPDPAR